MPRPKNGPLLSVSQIIQTARELLEREGETALTMRRLARELRVDPMALYYHIPNKEDLLRQIIEHLVAELELPDPQQGTWQDQLRTIARSYRRLGLSYPKTLPFLINYPKDLPSDFGIAEACLVALHQAGMADHQALAAFTALKAYVEGFTLEEISDTLLLSELSADMEGLEPQTYPRLWALYQAPASKPDPNADFEFGLSVFLLGLEQYIQAGKIAEKHLKT
jgi:AcrR family transcriptional regulator